jgi:thiamine biosynthesis lipoprotein
VAFDPGGIGKGLAADRVVATLLEAGADGACVNLGGDLRVRGRPPSGGAWSVGVEHPEDHERELPRLSRVDGAVATSSSMVRRWERAGASWHHLIDPRTGMSSHSRVSAATVVTGEAWWAEVLAKALFIAGPEEGGALLARSVACGLVVLDDGAVIELPGLEQFVA